MGRHGARAIRAHLMADYSLDYLDKLVENIGRGDRSYVTPTEIPHGEYRGVGFHEAPRGTLSHWIVMRGGKVKNYQVLVPSTWNASPRDEKGLAGPYEAALVGNPVAQVDKPLELLRTIHSFDPCISCAVHTIDPAGNEFTRVKVL
jgi:hydrogenase large subunit